MQVPSHTVSLVLVPGVLGALLQIRGTHRLTLKCMIGAALERNQRLGTESMTGPCSWSHRQSLLELFILHNVHVLTNDAAAITLQL